MTTVELFAGIGGFRFAADALGFETVWANDLCPKACAVYRNRFGGDVLHEGDIRLLADRIPDHELVTAGFPCQPFSSAGKKRGIRDSRGTLFQVIVDIARRRRPRWLVLENVKRLLTMDKGAHFATILTSLSELNYHLEWRLINAMHCGLPQNRQRVFILGTRLDSGGQDPARSRLPIRLASMEDLSTLKAIEIAAIQSPSDWHSIERHRRRFGGWGMAVSGRFFDANLAEFSAKAQPVSLRDVLQTNVAADFDFTEITKRWVSANTPVNRMVQGVEILSNQSGGARMGYTIFGISGLAPTLTSTTSRHYERYKIGDSYRRLTNIEYARIQGFSDDHCSAVSIYDQYALIGNAVPPPMARWVMNRLKLPAVSPSLLQSRDEQRTLFDNAY